MSQDADFGSSSPAPLGRVEPDGVERVDHPQAGRCVVLYRPVGPEECRLVIAQDCRAWPPRLEGQPIFYPVTNFLYAQEITERWNEVDYDGGFVTRFLLPEAFMARYPVQCVGAPYHTEWWIPAEDVDAMNQALVGRIEVLDAE